MSDEIGGKGVCAWTKAFHSSGLFVTLPVPVNGENYDYAHAFRAVSLALEAGWLVNLPGLEAGEQREEIGYVLRRTKVNDDRSETPIIDLYPNHERATFKCFSHYLNSPDHVKAFEVASGVSLASLKNLPGATPERVGNWARDGFIVKAPRPFGVILEPNERYNESEAEAAKKANKVYKVAKRVFVRWDGGGTAPKHVEHADSPLPSDTSDAAFDYLMGELNNASTAPALQKAWGDVNSSKDRLTATQLSLLEATKDRRKAQLIQSF